MPPVRPIDSSTVRDDFNDPLAVVYYTRAAHFLGLWRSERVLIERFFPDRDAPLLEAGCGAGRATIGLWDLGYRHLTAFDFAAGLLEQARHLATTRGIPFLPLDPHLPNFGHGPGISFLEADATAPAAFHVIRDKQPEAGVAGLGSIQAIAATCGGFTGALFLFNGLMQIPGRENRRRALRGLRSLVRSGAPLLFTTHDRDWSPNERAMWRLEAMRWREGRQDPRLAEFGDRYFEDESGRTFMHLPDRTEILEDLAATGWTHEFDSMRHQIAAESDAVRNFADECRFWFARAR